jgi:hypothetical protein
MTVANCSALKRAELDIQERAELLGGSTPDSARRLLHNDYVWMERVAVIWPPVEGALQPDLAGPAPR